MLFTKQEPNSRSETNKKKIKQKQQQKTFFYKKDLKKKM